MAKSIYELFNAAAIALYWQTLHSNTLPYLGATLFPNKRMQGLKLDWIKGMDQLPVMLMPSAFDAKPTLRDRGGVATQTMKMPFFREAMRIGEEDRQQLLTLLAAGGTFAQTIINKLFDDSGVLIDGAVLNPEVMRMQLLQNGTINIASPSDSGETVNYSYNYDPNGTWASTNVIQVTTAWTATGAKIIADILSVKRAAMAKGVVLTRAIIGPDLWAVLLSDPTIAKDIYPLAQDTSIADNELQQYLLKKTGITFTVYEKMYKSLAGVDTAFMEANKIVFLPSSTVGYTYYSTTPEEADLMTGNVDCDIRIVNGGIAVGSKKESLPVNVLTWVSEIVLPSFEQMNAVFVLKTGAA